MGEIKDKSVKSYSKKEIRVIKYKSVKSKLKKKRPE
jgi:hypothetical protein